MEANNTTWGVEQKQNKRSWATTKGVEQQEKSKTTTKGVKQHRKEPIVTTRGANQHNIKNQMTIIKN
jgi:hypothetical protein